MTLSQQMQCEGARIGLADHGLMLTTDTGLVVLANVIVDTMLPDPEKPAQAKTPVYTTIQVLITDMTTAQARAILRFAEDSMRTHRVRMFKETSGEAIYHQWECEAQRQ